MLTYNVIGLAAVTYTSIGATGGGSEPTIVSTNQYDTIVIQSNGQWGQASRLYFTLIKLANFNYYTL